MEWAAGISAVAGIVLLLLKFFLKPKSKKDKAIEIVKEQEGDSQRHRRKLLTGDLDGAQEEFDRLERRTRALLYLLRKSSGPKGR